MKARLFAEADPTEPDHARLDRATTKHLRSLRLNPGDRLEVVLGPGLLWRAVIDTNDPAGATVRLEQKLEAPVEDPRDELWLLIGLADLARTETLVEKATELGASDLLFFRASRSQSRNLSRTRLRRLERIAKSACEQCRRTWPPRIHTATDLATAVAALPSGITALALDPEATEPLLPRTGAVGLLLGPEGGFTSEELAWIDAQGILQRGLGPRVLRFETAAIAALARIQGT